MNKLFSQWPNLFFSLLVLGFLTLVVSDHLTSQTLSGINSPARASGACAPCGAPCKAE
jgi:hypothetical protein